MTWHAVTLGLGTKNFASSREHMINAKNWCAESLSSNGVLWKHDSIINWSIFYFAQPQDAVLFRLMFG